MTKKQKDEYTLGIILGLFMVVVMLCGLWGNP